MEEFEVPAELISSEELEFSEEIFCPELPPEEVLV